MTRLLLVGTGGFLGSVARYLVSGYVQTIMQTMRSEMFPYGTLAVNVIGCFVIGAVSYASDTHAAVSPDARAFIVVGILGGFTTFSAFGNETFDLLRASQIPLASVYVIASVCTCLASVWAGRAAAGSIL